VPQVPTNRELRILRNLLSRNQIWEAVGRKYFTQYDEITGKEIRIPCTELKHMETCGWIQLIHHPEAAQRLDRYEITTPGASLVTRAEKKSPQPELEPAVLSRRRRRA
jgi:hypothetical protein